MDITNIANLRNPEAAILETKKIGIDGLTHAECARTIEEALRGHRGVKEVHIDPTIGMAYVTFDTRETNFPEIHDILLESGYRAARSAPE